jgi:TonB family protein
MAPATKEAAETVVSIQQSPAQQPILQPKSPSGSSPSGAISLEVAVRVHGSRFNAVAGATPQSGPFSEQTTTMIVFPQGAALRMTTAVSVGQMLVLTNLKSQEDAICRVIRVRSVPKLQGYVEVEFMRPQASYWGVRFSSEGPAVAQRTSTAGPKPEIRPELAPEVVRVPAPVQDAPAPKPAETAAASHQAAPVQPPVSFARPQTKPAWMFIPLESKEEIQPAASAMSEASLPQPSEKQSYGMQPRRNDVAADLPVLPLPDAKSVPLQDSNANVDPLAISVEGDSEAKHDTPDADANLPNASRGVGAFGAPAILPEQDAATSADSFRRAFADAEIGRGSAASSRQNWMLIAACAAVLLIAAGDVWYFYSKPAAGSAATSTRPSSAVQQQTRSGITRTPSASVPSSATKPARTNFNTAKSMFSPKVMKAHPRMLLRKNESRAQAPVLDPAALAGDQPAELPGIVSPNSALPLSPRVAPEGPVRVGGLVKQPKLISSTTPTYPIMAKQAHIQGDVVIDTLIDKNGNVSHVKGVSGPSILRQAALDALSRWKFEPSQLDGQPVEVEVLVTIKFRL